MSTNASLRLAAIVSVAVSGTLGCSGDAFTASDPAPAGGASGAPGAGGGVATAAGGSSAQGGAGTAGNGEPGGGGGSLGGTSGAAGHAGSLAAGGHGGDGGSAGGSSVCAAGQFHCNGDVLQACDATKNGFVDLQTCPAGLCDEPKGRCETCHPGDVMSCKDSSTLLVCASDGTNSTAKACGAATPFCTGAGQCVECTMPSQCSAPLQTCFEAECGSGTCTAVASKQGTVVPAPGGKPTHDCTKTVCNGSGGTTKVADATNVPVDDGSGCTKPVCSGETPGYAPLDAGTSCGAGAVCTGTGKCAECVPGATRCEENGVRTCGIDGSWVGALVECVAPSPVCSAGSCQSVTQIVIGVSHSCALLGDGTVRCWGSNQEGQTGQPLATDVVLHPALVTGLPNVVSLAAGGWHTCALDASGHAWCWGLNDGGQVGDGMHGTENGFPGTLFSPPVQVKTTEVLSEICVAGLHTCALTAGGEVLCWGVEFDGQTGLVSAMDADHAALPQVANSVPIAGATHLYCGAQSTCVLGEKGLFCWGRNMEGELGSAPGPSIADPPQAVTGSVVQDGQTYELDFTTTISLSVGDTHTCALVVPQGIVCWGQGTFGELGNGSSVDSSLPVAGDPFNNFIGFGTDWKSAQVVAGGGISCFVDPMTDVACLGVDDAGELGDGNPSPPKYSTSLLRPTGITKGTTFLAAGESTTCAINKGEVLCWGKNTSGETGVGLASSFVAQPAAVVW